jgi:EmrB/QacA subfamily drug resistance transporter
MTTTPDPRRWQALALVCVAFFMTVLDVSIVNVALPSIGGHLHVADKSLQWVVVAYAITFGGFLLLGGRSADLLGRRRMFMAGVGLFAAASLVCGLAGSLGVLVAARAVQGLGAAVVSPATLSIITTTFEEGAERNKALGIWGAMGGGGAAAGVLFGGILTKYLGWEWIFFVNVPVGAIVLALTPGLVRESRLPHARRFDVAGAVSVTGGLALLVYAISKAQDYGWSSGRTIGTLVAAAVLIAAFVAIELRTRDPLMPLRIFRLRTLTGANAVSLLLGAVVYSSFFLLTLYVQQVLGFSSLKTGVTFLATAGTVVLVAGISQALTTRIGPKPVMVLGMLLIAGAMAWYTQVPPDGSYAADLLAGYLMMGFGMAFAFIPVSVTALAGVADREAGLASGLLNTSQQIGGAIGLAVAATVATTHMNSVLAALGRKPTQADFAAAATSGFDRAFWLLLAFALLGALAALVLVRRADVPDAEAVSVPV